MKVAIIYHTQEGQTEQVAKRIATTLETAGRTVELYPVAKAPESLLGYGAVLVGGSIHMGKHHRDLVDFVKKQASDLSTVTSAFFSVSMSAGDSGERGHLEADRYVHEFIEATGWHPDAVAMFGGALKYTRYGFVKRKMIQMIARGRGQPTDTKHDHEFTDWEEVDHFAQDILGMSYTCGESKPAWD
jgi:menaquinone-dependent protoporphyrinogen oxidase